MNGILSRLVSGGTCVARGLLGVRSPLMIESSAGFKGHTFTESQGGIYPTTSRYHGTVHDLCMNKIPSCTNVHYSERTTEVKARLKLRCRSCYFIRVNGRLHIECSEHPRHKAREIFDTKLLW